MKKSMDNIPSMFGNKTNILGRDIVALHNEYDIKIFEEFNIFVCDASDITKDIEYRNCTFHFLYLSPLKKWKWNYNATDTLTLNFINLSNTYHADSILNTIMLLRFKKNNFDFIKRKLFAEFINFNINFHKNEEDETIFGSELFVPLEIEINNLNNLKLKLDLFPFSNNYLAAGTNIITNIKDIKIKSNKKLKILNNDITVLN